MNSILKAISIFLVTTLSAGCVQTIDISNQNNVPLPVNVGELRVVDLTRDNKAGRFDGVWSNEAINLGDDATNPPFRMHFVRNVRERLTADGGSSAIGEITFIDVGILQEMRGADSLAGVGIISSLSPREYTCFADINLNISENSYRKEFISAAPLNLSWFDLPITDRQQFVEKCTNDLLGQIAVFINSQQVIDKKSE